MSDSFYLGNAFTLLRVQNMPEVEMDSPFEFVDELPSLDDEQRTRLVRMPDKKVKELELQLETFKVRHEMPKRRLVRVGKKEAKGFLEPKDFSAYFYREDELLVCHTAKDVAWSLAKRLDGEEIEDETVEVARRKVNISQLLDIAKDASGAWFRYAETDNRRATAIFADDMRRTDEFKKALADGTLSVIHFNYKWNGEPIHVAVSAKGTIQVLETELKPMEQLAVTLRIWVDFLEPIQE